MTEIVQICVTSFMNDPLPLNPSLFFRRVFEQPDHQDRPVGAYGTIAGFLNLNLNLIEF